MINDYLRLLNIKENHHKETKISKEIKKFKKRILKSESKFICKLITNKYYLYTYSIRGIIMIQNVDIENLCELEKSNNNKCKIKRVKKTEKQNLKNIIIPNYITSIDDYAFNNCFSLESIEIPSSVTSIGINAFINCTNLKNIYYSGTIEDWCNIKFYNSFSNPMYNKNRFFMKDNNGKYQEVIEIVIPNSVKRIKEYQFFGFNNIKVIKIQNGAETIGPHAFAYCQSLENVLIPDSVTNIELYAFWYCTSLISAKIPNSVKK